MPPAPPVHQHSSTNDDELRSQLDNARSEINRLRLLLSAAPEIANSEADLRRRTPRGPLSEAGTTAITDGDGDDGETDIGTTVETAIVQQDGVPPQMVVGIALVVFILTYIFF